MTWIDEINGRGPWDVGLQLGLQARARRHLGPCPACGQDRRSKSDGRKGAIFLVGNSGWKCGVCGMGGGAVQLAALRVLGQVPPKGDPAWRELRADLASRGLCTPADGAVTVTTPRPLKPVHVAAEEAAPARPRVDDVAALWRACRPVSEDPEVSAWIRSRGLDPMVVDVLELARAIPPELAALPRWAGVPTRAGWVPWSAGWRCLIRAWDHMGIHASFRARWCQSAPAPAGARKTAAAAAGERSSVGLVLADRLAVEVLRLAAPPTWWPPDLPLRLVVVEGEPDWLTWSCRVARDGDPYAPGVIGVWSGSWSTDFADRMPLGCELEVRTHDDPDGHRYRDRVYQSVRGKCRVLAPRSVGCGP